MMRRSEMTATRTPAQAPSDAGLQSRNIGRLALQGGAVLPDVEIAYLSMGRLRMGENNVVLVTHGLTSGPQMLLASDSVTGEGTWSNLVGPGCAIDTDRYFVVCPNMLGSSYGSTGPTSIDPTTGKPYGPAFPAITVGDIVRSQRRLLQELGIDRVHAVVGPSYGGIQALQWAIDFPALVDAIAVVVSGPRFPASLTVDAVRDVLRRDPNWNDGHYAEQGGIDGTMKRLRLDTLHNYGLLEVLADQVSTPPNARGRSIAWPGSGPPSSTPTRSSRSSRRARDSMPARRCLNLRRACSG